MEERRGASLTGHRKTHSESSNYESLGIGNNGPTTRVAAHTGQSLGGTLCMSMTQSRVRWGQRIERAAVMRSRGGRERAQLPMRLPPLLMGY